MSCPKRPRSTTHSRQIAFLQALPLIPLVSPRQRSTCHNFLHRRPICCVTPVLFLSAGRTREDVPSSIVDQCGQVPPSPSLPERVRVLDNLEKEHELPEKSEPAETKKSRISDEPREENERVRPKRVVSAETRRKISFAMLGQRRSDQMRAKVSEKLKGRVPWNKGKKLSPETRARMSEARLGRLAWNKGRRLTYSHRNAISKSTGAMSRTTSPETRRRMRMARRRPGDAILSGSSSGPRPDVGSHPLVDSAEIHNYITLRRELRVWSDSFMSRNAKRPSLADIRRVAPPHIMRKFERYVRMRDRIRGLASDVYGSVNPADVPVVSAGEVTSEPRNNNAKTVIRVTKHGNRRLVDPEGNVPGNGEYRVDTNRLEGTSDDMWDMYDRPTSPLEDSKSAEANNTLIGAHELSPRRKDQLSANDYRMIGKYRLMETTDINRYVKLRKDLEQWSATFKERNGRTPKLSDVKSTGKSMWYSRFCEYLGMRDRISGLVREVYQTEIDDVATLQKVNEEGKVILDTLRSGMHVETEP